MRAWVGMSCQRAEVKSSVATEKGNSRDLFPQSVTKKHK